MHALCAVDAEGLSFHRQVAIEVKVLAQESRFDFGVYRRHTKVIAYLGKIDRLIAVPVTTCNWNTIAAIARVLDNGATDEPATARAAAQEPVAVGGPLCSPPLNRSVAQEMRNG